VGRPAARLTPEPPARLVRFEATDGAMLSGLLYEPRRRTNGIVLWLHGTGGASVFDSRRTNVLAAEFLARGLAYFPFNNRGAHVVRRVGGGWGGSAHEVIRDCVHDIDGALRELRRRGYTDVTLAGHSTGANKVAVYDHYKPRNRVRRYVLLAGGDDTGLLHEQLGGRGVAALMTKARAMVKGGRGEELMPSAAARTRSAPRNALPPGTTLSWRAFLDMADPRGDYNVFPFAGIGRFRFLRAIRKPALYVYGQRDEYVRDIDAAMATLAKNVAANGEIVVLSEADHGFGGRESELAALMTAWIASR
jgi:pimeloyl-ACP methyl ester carboxylesterase